MTDEMLDLARRNQAEAGTSNVEFLKGYIEDDPTPRRQRRRRLSNCVINLSTNKHHVSARPRGCCAPAGASPSAT